MPKVWWGSRNPDLQSSNNADYSDYSSKIPGQPFAGYCESPFLLFPICLRSFLITFLSSHQVSITTLFFRVVLMYSGLLHVSLKFSSLNWLHMFYEYQTTSCRLHRGGDGRLRGCLDKPPIAVKRVDLWSGSIRV